MHDIDNEGIYKCEITTASHWHVCICIYDFATPTTVDSIMIATVTMLFHRGIIKVLFFSPGDKYWGLGPALHILTSILNYDIKLVEITLTDTFVLFSA